MPYRIQKQYRKPGHDYTLNNGYFITICAKDRRYYFGQIKNHEMILSFIGEIVRDEWLKTPKIRKNVILDNWVIMPNHFHAIIILEDKDQSAFHDCIDFNCRNEALPRSKNGKNVAVPRSYDANYFSKISPKPGSISTIIGSFKSKVSKIVHQKYPDTNFAWQPRFYDRIIRDEEELYNIQNYIYNNPFNWYRDRNNLENLLM